MKKEITVFIPTRKGSERVEDKNTRGFAGIEGGLLKLKLQQTLQIKQVNEIILSTNDPASMEVADTFRDSRLRVIKRPDQLAFSSTSLTELIQYVPTICNFEHILWTHVTSPFTSTEQYEDAIERYFEFLNSNTHDSLMSGRWFQNFLWSANDNEVVNKTTDLKWPRTQDLKPLFEVDSAIFIASKEIYKIESDRIGKNPYLYAQKGLASFDIDWEDDFKIAERLYNYEH